MFLKWLLNLLCFVKFISSNNLPKPLSRKEEEIYLELYKNQNDENAKKILIERNLRLVANVAKKYGNVRRDMDDLLSIGTIGLIKGVTSYKLEKASKLSTYVSKCIENEILMSIRSGKKESKDVSINEQIGVDKEGNEISLIDVLCSGEKEVFEKIDLKTNVEKLYNRLQTRLTKLEIQVIIKRYGLYNTKTMTQDEVADNLNISRSYVSRIEKKSIEKLRIDFLEK
ncbi:MAG: RNA polymerase subunit sigma-70 [Clostridiales bacterium GWE2_32_10]|nr:MAG: RNA polymerase subunit sigma-70 [Clostridiales bacterium GWE2_32_10]HBY19894.1 RNA polymerase subunit sigma-70 [Clostridiales bacterium]